MRKYQNTASTAEGFNFGTQTPVDDRLYFSDIAELQDIGYDNNSRAFEYYEGMVIKVIDTAQMYMWKESPTGALNTPFTYPAGVIANGIDYSNRTFNFVPMSVSSSISTLLTNEQTISISGGTPYLLSIPAAIEITDVSIYTSSNVDVSDALDISIGTNQVIINSNINLLDLLVKTIYKQ